MTAMTIVEQRHLVDTAWVESHLDDPALRVFECVLPRLPSMDRIFRDEPAAAAWARGHVPGAGFLDIRSELSDPHSRWPLQFTMPTPKRFAEVMGAKGVGPDSRVVLYSVQHPMAATRVWWMLRAMGFDGASVMDGGWEKWLAEGRPVSLGACEYPQARFEPHPRTSAMAGRIEVRAAMRNPKVLLINALTRTQHAGGGVHYGTAGRIPGSRCVPAQDLVTEPGGCFRPEPELRRMFEAAGVHPGLRVIAYCGVGVAATCVAFTLVALGHEDVAVYDGSLAEWSNDPTLPLEIG